MPFLAGFSGYPGFVMMVFFLYGRKCVGKMGQFDALTTAPFVKIGAIQI
jgi:hypothetical protein